MLAKKKGKGKKPTQKEESEGSDESEADEKMESDQDAELEAQLAEEEEIRNPELLDETIFNKFATGELDLPDDGEDDEEVDSGEDEPQGEEDSELEAYYEELGIDAGEMIGEKGAEKKLYKKQKKEDVRKEKAQAAKRERNEILDAMMEKARKEPNYKTLTRIIQVVKAIFSEKIDAAKKKNKKSADDEEMVDGDEEKKATAAHKHTMFSKQLTPEEYQRLVHFFANELPSIALKLCQAKDFPNVDKLIQQAKYKNVKLG